MGYKLKIRVFPFIERERLAKILKRVIGVIEPVFQKRGNESPTVINCRAFCKKKTPRLSRGWKKANADETKGLRLCIIKVATCQLQQKHKRRTLSHER